MKTYLGIELGSTRIKAVLIDENHNSVASGGFTWENQLKNGYWTYSLDDVWGGLQSAYADLAANFAQKFGEELTTVDGIGISGMMHGYLPFDSNGNQLAEFRTWRNTTTAAAAKKLTAEFGFNIPERWSVAHLYQAILNDEEHVGKIDHITTVAGYVHWKLTGEKVVGINEASGMFPICDGDYNSEMLGKFDDVAKIEGFIRPIKELLPRVLFAGESAGTLTIDGAKLLDPSGRLQAGIPFCPPEGDAGTGMVATNAVLPRTGNVSAGTSIFAMVVLENSLKNVYQEIDVIATPMGDSVAMAHANNCTADLDAWVSLFGEALQAFGAGADKSKLYEILYNESENADAHCGNLLSYNYLSGEHITGISHGRPLLVRTPESNFTLANFMRSLLFSSVAALSIGMGILLERENVKITSIAGHGGLFKVDGVGQRMMAAALNASVSVSSTAGEGGAWGIAVLAAFARQKDGENLGEYLTKVFANDKATVATPKIADVEAFSAYIKRYKAGLEIEKIASEVI